MKFKFFKCPHCGKVSTAGEWNNTTLALCTGREARRKYVRIQDAGSRPKWYKCPHCSETSDNDKIKPLMASELNNEGGV